MYESDSGVYIRIVVQNNAKTPVLIAQELVLNVFELKNGNFIYLDAGERKHYVFAEGYIMVEGVHRHYNLNNGIEDDVTMKIYAHDTVMPKMSSDFVYSFREITYPTADYSIPPLIFNTLTYETNDRNWKYAVFEVNNPDTFPLDARITLHVTGESKEYYESRDNTVQFSIEPGETKTVQIPLRDYDPKTIRYLSFQSNRKT